MAEQTAMDDVALTVRKWKSKRGSLIMMLHELQDKRGFVPRELALQLADEIDVPLARIYEVLTFYNYFKLESPGRVVISVCTGTACHLKGAPDLVAAFQDELKIAEGETTEDGDFHLQSVRCVGCCGLAPVVTVNGKTYGKVKPAEVRGIVHEWRDMLAKADVSEPEAEAAEE